MKNYRLTQYSHGAGCGCKISPKVLDAILHTTKKQPLFDRLLVGNDTRDDAAVFDTGNGMAIISTTDFFMPVVDDAADFGRIASVNAISDVYAMGGTPLMAIAILGWPVDILPPEVAGQVIGGAREACAGAGIPLAGGHSIDSPEPVFGLAVTGQVQRQHLKKNGGGTENSSLYLTKPLGVGILSTAQKKGVLQEAHSQLARDLMVQLNQAGEVFGKQRWVQAMTDVTGFGLMGHLTEMCEASGISAELEFDKVPLIDREVLLHYLEQKAIPGGTHRNFDSYGHKLAPLSDLQRNLLCDPQTSGGLLVAVAAGFEPDFEALAAGQGLQLKPFGRLVPRQEKLVLVK